MMITRTSMISGVTRTLDIDVTEKQIDDCRFGWHHEVLKHLSRSEQEFIRSGVVAEEWLEINSKLKYK